MKTVKSAPEFLKYAEVISKEQLKTIMGGAGDRNDDESIGDGTMPCLIIGSPCLHNVDCCSNYCGIDYSSGSVGRICYG